MKHEGKIIIEVPGKEEKLDPKVLLAIEQILNGEVAAKMYEHFGVGVRVHL